MNELVQAVLAIIAAKEAEALEELLDAKPSAIRLDVERQMATGSA